MVAIPLKFEDALCWSGYTIDQSVVDGQTITVGGNPLVIPTMTLSTLTWQRGSSDDGGIDPTPRDSFYLTTLADLLFAPEYAPVLLSDLLDRFAPRRLAYDTPDDFTRSFRRKLNLLFGPMSILNRRFVSSAVPLPLTTQDATVDNTATSLARNAHSDFPQGQLGGNVDYASDAVDTSANTTSNSTYEGRQGVSVMALLEEQRQAFINVDEEALQALEPCFLALYDRPERDPEVGSPSRDYIGSMFVDW